VPSAGPSDADDRVTATRSRRRGLSRARVVDAALELVDEQGLAAVTMRALAARLGVEAMSLYRHVENRDKLFDAVVDRIVNELSTDDQVPERPEHGCDPT
jgi:TetR/AcrR family tetracycline transcriptional repressor